MLLDSRSESAVERHSGHNNNDNNASNSSQRNSSRDRRRGDYSNPFFCYDINTKTWTVLSANTVVSVTSPTCNFCLISLFSIYLFIYIFRLMEGQSCAMIIRYPSMWRDTRYMSLEARYWCHTLQRVVCPPLIITSMTTRASIATIYPRIDGGCCGTIFNEEIATN